LPFSTAYVPVLFISEDLNLGELHGRVSIIMVTLELSYLIIG